MNNLLAQSLTDLRDDFEELQYLTQSSLSRLNKFHQELAQVKKYIQPATYQETLKTYNYINNKYVRYSKELEQLSKSADSKQTTISLYEKLNRAKKQYFDLIRTNQGFIGSLITSTDWQSPSYNFSLISQAGVQTGKIIGTINDYKRDVHLDEEEFEKIYLKNYIDAPLKIGFRSLMTSSGMAAFTTIFNFLLMENKISSKVLLGKSSYFQYRQIILKTLAKKVIEFNETNTNEIKSLIIKEMPDAIFIDSLCNAKNIPVPDLPEIINFLKIEARKETYLIIDNTCLSVFFQPFKYLGINRGKIHIIHFESLMKYVHFGLDRVTGGMITARGSDAVKLTECRKHLGTNIADSSISGFPLPRRNLLEKRLQRHQRNALFMVNYLNEYMTNHKTVLENVIYPDPIGHPFRGSFFNLDFRKKSVGFYKKFIRSAIKEAKNQHVDLIAGTSFGSNTTRVYLTSLWTKFGEPFMRISVGTEDLLEIEKIRVVFISVINKIS